MKYKKAVSFVLAILMFFSQTHFIYAAEDKSIEINSEIDMENNAETILEEGDIQLLASDVTYSVKGGNIYFDSSEGAITEADSTVNITEIPTEINGVAVVKINSNAFKNNSAITQITIPETIESIGGNAFSSCSSLEKVIINGDFELSTSGINGVFASCKNLTDIEFGEKVTSINNYLFNNCTGLQSITIPENIKNIGSSAFAGTGLTEVTIPETVESIGAYAFHNCDSLEKVTINGDFELSTSGINGIFASCKNLTDVEFGEKVTSITKNLFIGCTGLQSITIPENIKNIGSRAFENTGLTEVTIPETVESIGSSAFEGTCLTEVTIPETVESIGAYAFHNCDSLEKVTINGDFELSTSGINGVFENCKNLTDIEFGEKVTSINNYLFDNCTGLQSITIPENIKNIGSSAFENTGLTSVELPKSLQTIGSRAFYNTAITEITIPEGVISISASAFENCTLLEKITVENPNMEFTGTNKIPDNTIFQCYMNSTTEKYCHENNIPYILLDAPYYYTVETNNSVQYVNEGNENINVYFSKKTDYMVLDETGKLKTICKNELSYVSLGKGEKLIVTNSTDKILNIFVSSDKYTFSEAQSFLETNTLEKNKNYLIKNTSDEDITMYCLKSVNCSYANYNNNNNLLSQNYNAKNSEKITISSNSEMIINVSDDLDVDFYNEYTKNGLISISECEETVFYNYSLSPNKTIKIVNWTDAAVNIASTASSKNYYRTAAKYGSRYSYKQKNTGAVTLENGSTVYIENVGSSDIIYYIPSRLINNDYFKISDSDTAIDDLISENYFVKVNFKVLDLKDNGIEIAGNLKDYSVSVYDVDQKKYIYNNTINRAGIILSDKIKANETLEISVNKTGYSKSTVTVELDDSGYGNADILLKELSQITINEKEASSDDLMRILLFDPNGDKYLGKTVPSNLCIDKLKQGNYTAIIMRCKAEAWNVNEIDSLDDFGFVEGTDYIKKDISVEDGIAAVIDVDSIPTSDYEKLSIFDLNKTNFNCNAEDVSTNSYIEVRFEYAIKDDKYENTSNNKLKFTAPSGFKFIDGSIIVDGEQIGSSGGSTVTIPISKKQGLVKLYLIAETYAEGEVKAEFNTDYLGVQLKEIVGSVSVNAPEVTIYTQPNANSENIEVTGQGIKGEVVSIYDNDTFVGKATINNKGHYKCDIKLLNAINGSQHILKAVVKDDKEAYTTVEYNEYEPVVEEFNITCTFDKTETYDLMDYQRRGITPTLRFYHQYPYIYKVKVSNDDKIDKLRVCGYKEGQKYSIDAVKKDGYYYAEGYFGMGTSVAPSDLYIEYDRKKDIDLTQENCNFIISKINPALADCNVIETVNNDKISSVKLQSSDGLTDITYTIDMTKAGQKYEGFNEATAEDDGFIKFEQDGQTYYAKIEHFEHNLFDDNSETDLLSLPSGYDEFKTFMTALYYACDGITEYKDDEGKIVVIKNAENVMFNEGIVIVTSGGDYVLQHVVEFCSQDSAVVSAGIVSAGNLASWAKVYFDPNSSAIDKEKANKDLMSNELKMITVAVVSGLGGKLGTAAGTAIGTAIGGPAGTLVGGYIGEIVGYVGGTVITELAFKLHVKWHIDPSVYVYEVIPDNRIQGGTTTVYYKDSSGNAVMWDADAEGQKNPLITDDEGRYAWFVPEGMWQVKYEKEGYETTYSDWLPVPPPQTEVNISMTSDQPAEIKEIGIEDGVIVVKFNRPVINSTMTSGNVVLKDSDGNEIEVNIIPESEVDYNDKVVSSVFTLESENAFDENSVYAIGLSSDITTYNGVNIEGRNIGINGEISPVITISTSDEAVEIFKDESKTISVTLDGAENTANVNLEVSSENADVAAADVTKQFTNGKAEVKITGIYSGTTSVTLTVPELNIKKVITVDVKDQVPVSGVYGDADNNGILTASDAAYIFRKAIDPKYKLPIEIAAPNYMSLIDVNNDGAITYDDGQLVLKKVRENDYFLPIEE